MLIHKIDLLYECTHAYIACSLKNMTVLFMVPYNLVYPFNTERRVGVEGYLPLLFQPRTELAFNGSRGGYACLDYASTPSAAHLLRRTMSNTCGQ